MKNESGIRATQYQVLVLPVEVEEKTQGGIILPEQTKEKDEHAADEGVLVDVSDGAFSYSDSVMAGSDCPNVGDHVVFARFAGKRVQGNDGKNYRLMNDKDIIAVRVGQ